MKDETSSKLSGSFMKNSINHPTLAMFLDLWHLLWAQLEMLFRASALILKCQQFIKTCSQALKEMLLSAMIL